MKTLEQQLKEITKDTTLDELLHHRNRFQTFYDILKSKPDTKKEDLFFCEEHIFMYNNLIYLRQYVQSQQGDNK
jgi:hypothetical protein